MRLSQAQECPLGYVERFGVMLHLLVCKGCTNFRARLIFRESDAPCRHADDAR